MRGMPRARATPAVPAAAVTSPVARPTGGVLQAWAGGRR